MKNKRKYFVAHFVTDLYFYDVEEAIYHAENENAVREALKDRFGKNLQGCEVREMTWVERIKARLLNVAVYSA